MSRNVSRFRGGRPPHFRSFAKLDSFAKLTSLLETIAELSQVFSMASKQYYILSHWDISIFVMAPQNKLKNHLLSRSCHALTKTERLS